MLQSFGHQTILKEGAVGDRLKLGPHKSLIVEKDGTPKLRPPFAGEGYYFWEDNIDAAEWWGHVRYIQKKKEYRIFRIDLTLRYDDMSFFDLIGNRQHLKLLQKMVEKTKMEVNCNGWKLHNYIAYFRILQTRKNGMFPFKMLRFNDYSLNPKIQDPLQLTDNQHKYLMNPFYIICVFEIDILDLATFKYIK